MIQGEENPVGAIKLLPTPIIERTYPEVPIMLSSNQVPSKVEQISDNRVNTQKSQCRANRFESPRCRTMLPSLPDPRRLVRLKR